MSVDTAPSTTHGAAIDHDDPVVVIVGSGAGGGMNCCPGKMIWPGSRCLVRCSAISGW